MKSLSLFAALSLLSVPVFAAPNDAPTTPATATTPAKPKRPRKPKAAGTAATPRVKGTAYVRVLHAIPGAPAVDVFMDGTKVLDGVAYKTVSAYLPVPSGAHTFKVVATGQTTALLQAKRSLMKDKFFTIIAYGTPTTPTLLAQNDVTGKVLPGKARLRAFHLVSGGPTVSVTMPSTRTKAGYANVFKTLAFGKSAAKTVAPGTFTLQLRADGKLLKEVPGVVIAPDKRYEAFAVGTPDGTGDSALNVIFAEAGEKTATAAGDAG